ncbi:MAG: radical SAM protein [Elusimicrobiota bacterium]
MTYLPKRVIIETEYTCNLKCKTCILWQDNYRKIRSQTKTLKIEELKYIHQKLKENEVERITYIGGEPFLKSYIIKAFEDAKEKKLKTSVVTNATLLNENIINKILKEELLETIIFSIDGDRETHNQIRGDTTFQKAYNNALILSRLKRKLKKRFPKFFIYTTISKLNYRNIETAIKELIKLNPNKIRLQLISSIDEKIINITNQVLGFKAIKTHSYINELFLDDSELKWLKNSIKTLPESGPKIEIEKLLIAKNERCQFIEKEFIITPDGRILICPMLNEFYIGNIYQESLTDIFTKNIDKIETIKNLANSKKLPVCYQCCVEKISFDSTPSNFS